MDLLVTYDIATEDAEGQRRLNRVAKVCEGYGLRVQYSVFECRLSATACQRLVIELLDVIDRERDCVHLYRFPGDLTTARRTLGRSSSGGLGRPWVV